MAVGYQRSEVGELNNPMSKLGTLIVGKSRSRDREIAPTEEMDANSPK